MSLPDAGTNAAVALDFKSVKSAVILYFALLGVSAGLMVTGMVVELEDSANLELAASAMFAVVVLAAVVMNGGRSISGLLAKRFHPGWILFGVAGAVPTYLLASGVVNLLYDWGVEKVDYLQVFLQDGYGFGWAVVVVCVEPAIFEEIAFRGMIQTSLTRVLAEREALVVCALMFGILHLSIPSLPHLLVIGLVLGWLRMRTKSLLPGMALHFTHNFLVIASDWSGTLLRW